jgi:hypothetical protein
VLRTSSKSLSTMLPLFTMLPTGRDPNAIVDKAFKLQ